MRIAFYGADAVSLGEDASGFTVDDDLGDPTPKTLQGDAWTYVRVRNVFRRHHEGLVYDIHVDGQHAYLANWAVVHNSIPFYGLSRERARVVEREAARNRFFAYLMRAHFHTDGELQTTIGRDILVGSLKGPCEHGVNFGGHKPTQTLFGMHREHGKSWHLPLEPAPRLDRTACRYKYDRTVAVGMQELPE